LQDKKNEKKFNNHFSSFYNEVFSIINANQNKYPYPLIPASPSRYEDSAIIGAISALYPCRLIKPRDLRLTGTLRFIRHKFTREGGFLHRLVHSGFNVYLTAQIAQCYLFRRSSRLIPILEWMLENISHTGTYPEAIHPRTKQGCMGDGHHGWAAADFLHLCRNLIFFEEENTLVITPVTFRRWFESGEKISIQNAASYFGIINLNITNFTDYVELSLDNKYWYKPQNIEFSVSFPIRKTDQNNKITFLNSRTISFSPDIKSIKIYR
jgi:hypothetical protein